MRAIMNPFTGEFGLHYNVPWMARVSVKKAGNDLGWMVWVPPRFPEDFDAEYPGDLAEWQQIVDEAPIKGPYADTYWPTFEEAIEFALEVAEGEDRRLTAREVCS